MTLDKCLNNIKEPITFSLSVYKNKSHSVKVRIKIKQNPNGFSLDYIEKVLDSLNIIPITPTSWEICRDHSIRAPLPSDYKYFFTYTLKEVNI